MEPTEDELTYFASTKVDMSMVDIFPIVNSFETVSFKSCIHFNVVICQKNEIWVIMNDLVDTINVLDDGNEVTWCS